MIRGGFPCHWPLGFCTCYPMGGKSAGLALVMAMDVSVRRCGEDRLQRGDRRRAAVPTRCGGAFFAQRSAGGLAVYEIVGAL